MRRAVLAAAVAVAVGASGTARAHEFRCTKQVGPIATGQDGEPLVGEDGLPVFLEPGPVGLLQLDAYPATVAFQIAIDNLAADPSTVSGIVDPLDHWIGGANWGFVSTPPLALGLPIPPGESRSLAYAFRLDSYEQCLALAAHVAGEAPVCGGTVPNLFGLRFETGYAECRAELVCLPDAAPALAAASAAPGEVLR